MTSIPNPSSTFQQGTYAHPEVRPTPTLDASEMRDYGPMGTVPSTEDAIYLGAEATGKNGATAMRIGLAIGILGLVLMFVHAPAIGGILLAFGVFLFFVGRSSGKKHVYQDIISDRHGLTVRRHSRAIGEFQQVKIPWHLVTATRCPVKVTNQESQESSRTFYTQEFVVEKSGSQALRVDELDFRQLAELIDTCNRNTQHLGYRWLPNQAAQSLPVIETSLKFTKVPLRYGVE